MERSPETCVLCGASDREILIEKNSWHVYRCLSCGLGFLDPRPSREDVENLYSKEYFTEQYDKGVDPNTRDFKKRLNLEAHRIRFFRGLRRQGRVLDIGCGNGYFLAACRYKGYEVQGIDVSDWAIQYATQKLGILAHAGEINTVTLSPQSFDIITMWHFLEHTRDPRQTILKVKNWMKKDGIMIIDVPNYESTDARKNWKNWIGWQLPYHFYHFNPKALKILVEMCGFHIVKTKNYHSEAVKMALKGIPLIGLFARLIAKMYSGTSIAVVAILNDHS